MASIRFRTHKWQCRIQRQGYPILSNSFNTKEDAQRWARGIERSMDLGEYTSAETTTTTLADLIDRYKKEVTPTKRGAVQEMYRLGVVRADKIATLNIKAITSAEVAAFRDRRLGKVKPVTARHDLCALSGDILYRIYEKYRDLPLFTLLCGDDALRHVAGAFLSRFLGDLLEHGTAFTELLTGESDESSVHKLRLRVLNRIKTIRTEISPELLDPLKERTNYRKLFDLMYVEAKKKFAFVNKSGM